MYTLLIEFLVLGVNGGFNPGPLSMFIISESFQHGSAAGIRASFAPLITDAPIACVAILFLSHMANQSHVLGAIALAGAVMIAWIGVKAIRFKKEQFQITTSGSGSLVKAIGVNFLNPNPYVFWFSILGPKVVTAWNIAPWFSVLLVTVFYVVILIIKFSLSLAAGGARHHINTNAMVIVNRVMGCLLLCLSVKYIYDAVQKFTQ